MIMICEIMFGATLVALCDLIVKRILHSIGDLGVVAGVARVIVDSVVAGVIGSQISVLGGLNLVYYLMIVSLYFVTLLMAD